MSAIAQVLSAVFWGLIVLSLLVFIHEAGHYLAARAFGVRVTEFMLGLPCRWRLSFRSKKVGTEIGVTPLLLGGYNRICGMEPAASPDLARVLACVQAHGRVSVADVADELGITGDEALAALVTLADWSSIRPFYNPELGEKPSQSTWPAAFETLARDAQMRTEFDRGHDFGGDGASEAGEARPIEGEADAFTESERSRTYLGLGFWKRAVVLVAGPLVNVVFAFAIVCAAFMVKGIPASSSEAVIGMVAEQGIAASSGIEPGDRVLAVDGEQVDSWTSFTSAMKPYLEQGRDFTLTVEREGSQVDLAVDLPDGQSTEMIGVYSATVVYYPNLAEAAGLTLRYGQTVASYVVKLIIPQETMEVLSQSSSIVGISVMASQAAQTGPSSLVLLAASISMSLGFMNLLPIPPLDGGKLLIEVIQAGLRRQLSVKAQNYISYVGLAFFIFVFVVVLKNDVVRYVIG